MQHARMQKFYSPILKYKHFVHISTTVINPNAHADTVQFYEVYQNFH